MGGVKAKTNVPLWPYLASRDLKDFQLSLCSKIGPSVANMRTLIPMRVMALETFCCALVNRLVCLSFQPVLRSVILFIYSNRLCSSLDLSVINILLFSC